MRHVLVALLWLIAIAVTPALSQDRVALVVGNAGYKAQARLANPANDASDMTDALGKLGFRVQRLDEADYDTMRRGLRDFASAAQAADYAVVFYAGHGVEIGGENYLVPVDATLRSDQDISFEAIPLRSVMQTVQAARKLGLVILDACRVDPFRAQMVQASGRTRSLTRGLARVEPSGNVLVAYAAREGTLAADGTRRNSPFTEALLKHIARPSLDIRNILGFVRDEVRQATGNQQEPAIYGSLGGDMIMLASLSQTGTPEIASNASAATEFAKAYAAATAAAWDDFLARHPTGLFADLARTEREKFPSKRTAVNVAAMLSYPSTAEYKLPRDARLFQIEHNTSWIETVSYSKSGRRALVGSRDGIVRIIDLLSGEVLRQYRGHARTINAASFSSDERYIISSSDDRTLHFWEVATGTLKWSLVGHSLAVNSVAVSTDDQFALSGGDDGVLNLWDLSNGSLVRSLAGHTGRVTSVAFAPDGKAGVSGGADKTVKLWDLINGKMTGSLSGHDGQVSAIAISPDGRYVVSGSWDHSIKLWDRLARTLVKSLNTGSDYSASVAFSADGALLVSGGGKNIRLWNVTTGTDAGMLSGHSSSVRSVAFSPDGQTILSGSYDRSVKMWSMRSGAALATYTFSKDGSLAYAADGTFASSNDPSRWFAIVQGTETLTISDFIAANRRETLALPIRAGQP